MNSCLVAVAALFLVFLSQVPGFCSVVINEIHYNPPAPDGRDLEFVELFNSGATAVSLDGWKLEGGISFEFPSGLVLPAGAYALVCRDSNLFASRFNLPEADLLGDFEGSLDNDGDEVLLLDSVNALVDGVKFDDRNPWPEGSEAVDGGGASLERLCVSASAGLASNWASAAQNTPTPLAQNSKVECPPAPAVVSDVVINELHYPPAGSTEELDEFVELHNHSQ